MALIKLRPGSKPNGSYHWAFRAWRQFIYLSTFLFILRIKINFSKQNLSLILVNSYFSFFELKNKDEKNSQCETDQAKLKTNFKRNKFEL